MKESKTEESKIRELIANENQKMRREQNEANAIQHSKNEMYDADIDDFK